MPILSNLKLRQRLILSVAVMAAAMALAVIAEYQVSEQAVDRLNRVYEQANTKIIAGVQLANAYSRDLDGLMDKLVSGAYPWEVGPARLEQIKGEIGSSLEILQKPPLDPDETLLLQDVQDKDSAVDAFIGQLRPVLEKKDRRELEELSRKLHPCVDPMGFRIQLFLDYELGLSRMEVKASQASFQASYGWMGGLALLSVVLLFWAVSSHLGKTVSQPMAQLVDRMKHIAQEEGDLTKRLEIQGKDEIGEVAEAFNTFVSKLQTVEDMKLDLISVTSHQLKTPVAEVNGFIDNMLMGITGRMNPRQTEYLEEMRRIGQENYKLISDLLSVSKIDRGVLTVDLKPVQTDDVVAQALKDYEQILAKKGLDLMLEGLEDDILVLADKDKMVEVLHNLLNNAIKCTDRGFITIRTAKEGDWGLIEVADTGIGMDEQTLQRLFTKNRVLGQEAHRSGAGLGLYICRSFMRLQGGDITAASELGKGSVFKMKIPLYQGAQE